MKMVYVSYIAIRELLFERVFYVLLSFALMGVVASIALGQITYADQAKLSLDFMLAGAQISMVLFSVFVGIGLFQREILVGSVAMVLSKPISRATFLLGKYFGQLAVQAGVVMVMAGLTLAAHWLEQPSTNAVAVGIIQSYFFAFLEAAVLTALTYWIASFCGSITTGAVVLSVFFVGHFRKVFESSSQGSWVWAFAEKLVPHLELFNIKTQATYGFSLPIFDVFWVAAYAIVCATMFVLLAVICFGAKDIPT